MSDESTLTAIAVDAGGDALRERLIDAVTAAWDAYMPSDATIPTNRQCATMDVDVLYTEIAAAGWSLVLPGELRAAITQLVLAAEQRDSSSCVRAWAVIDGMLGDLDPVVPPEAGR